MKWHIESLVKCAVHRREPSGIPLLSHSSLNQFTLEAFDNFNHDDKCTLSGLSSSQDTAIKLFQLKPEQPVTKPTKSEVYLDRINLTERLPYQEIVPFNSNRVLLIPDEFHVPNGLYCSDDFKYKMDEENVVIDVP